jgi:hypothetical protein
MSLAEQEIDIKTVDILQHGKVLTDRNCGKLAKWQRDSAIEHWAVMRQTLSGEQWRAF